MSGEYSRIAIVTGATSGIGAGHRENIRIRRVWRSGKWAQCRDSDGT